MELFEKYNLSGNVKSELTSEWLEKGDEGLYKLLGELDLVCKKMLKGLSAVGLNNANINIKVDSLIRNFNTGEEYIRYSAHITFYKGKVDNIVTSSVDVSNISEKEIETANRK